MGIFGLLDSSANPGTDFWQSLPSSFNTESLVCDHFGVLQYLEGDNDVQAYNLALVGSKLFRYEGSWDTPQNVCTVDIRWKVCEPFVEEFDHDIVSGFSLEGIHGVVEFYTNSVDELNIWVSHLSEISILTRFEEEFEIREKIGEGSNAEIYSALSAIEDRVYAVKKINKYSIIDNPAKLAGLANEIEALRTINHKNVIKVHRIYDMPEDVAIVMDYLPYGTLSSRLFLRKKFSEEVTCRLIWTLLDTLEYLNKAGFIHRDLKPENILMASETDDTDIKICDFGLVLFDAREIHTLKSGSPGYIAPEIFENKCYGPKVDLFSIGVIMYQLLAGCQPFTASNTQKILEKNRKCLISYSTKLLDHVSVSGLSLIKALTNPNPKSRPSVCNAKNSVWFTICRNHSSIVSGSQCNFNDFPPRRANLLTSPQVSFNWTYTPKVSCLRVSNLLRSPNLSEQTSNSLLSAVQRLSPLKSNFRRSNLKSFKEIASVSYLTSIKLAI